jgi:hypothetical protein
MSLLPPSSSATWTRCPATLPAERIIRELRDRAVGRLRLRATHLHRSYARLAQPPENLQADELLGGVVAGLLRALRSVRPSRLNAPHGTFLPPIADSEDHRVQMVTHDK